MQLDPNSQYHIEFIAAAAMLRAENFNILSEEQCREMKDNFEGTLDEVRKVLKTLPAIKEFVPKDGVQIASNDQELNAMNESSADEGLLNAMIAEVKEALTGKSAATKLNCKAIDFEKDDERNWHIEYVTAASNNRAWNYSIEMADKFQVGQLLLMRRSMFWS